MERQCGMKLMTPEWHSHHWDELNSTNAWALRTSLTRDLSALEKAQSRPECPPPRVAGSDT